MAGKKSNSGKKGDGTKLIASNKMAKRNYVIESIIEAGIVLTGTEIKSLRTHAPNLGDAYVEIRGKEADQLEAWLLYAHIPPYSHGNIWNHDPTRRRKLLLHRKEINRMFGAIRQQGITVVPTRLYFKKGFAKVELGLGKGKKLHDKRDTTKKRDAEREMDRARKLSRR